MISPLSFYLSVIATATAAAILVAAENAAQGSVLPHRVDYGDKYGRTATGKDAVYAVAATACRNK